MPAHRIFSRRFLDTLKTLIAQHHTIYPRLPPQGIYFESLVERAFRLIRQPYTPIEPSNPNSPKHDLLVRNARTSVKTETGSGTKLNYVNITKLCTTERGPWTPEALIRHALDHLSRYDYSLMLRAVWEGNVVHYQVLDVPVALLRRLGKAQLQEVGHRQGRRSLAGDVRRGEERLFHVHFDGADGKCQIQRLAVSCCEILSAWMYQLAE